MVHKPPAERKHTHPAPGRTLTPRLQGVSLHSMGGHPKYEVIWTNPPREGRRWPGELRRKVGTRYVTIELSPRSLLTTSEAGSVLNQDPATIWRWIRAGKLKAVMKGRRALIPMRALKPHLPEARPGNYLA